MNYNAERMEKIGLQLWKTHFTPDGTKNCPFLGNA